MKAIGKTKFERTATRWWRPGNWQWKTRPRARSRSRPGGGASTRRTDRPPRRSGRAAQQPSRRVALDPEAPPRAKERVRGLRRHVDALGGIDYDVDAAHEAHELLLRERAKDLDQADGLTSSSLNSRSVWVLRTLVTRRCGRSLLENAGGVTGPLGGAGSGGRSQAAEPGGKGRAQKGIGEDKSSKRALANAATGKNVHTGRPGRPTPIAWNVGQG